MMQRRKVKSRIPPSPPLIAASDAVGARLRCEALLFTSIKKPHPHSPRSRVLSDGIISKGKGSDRLTCSEIAYPIYDSASIALRRTGPSF